MRHAPSPMMLLTVLLSLLGAFAGIVVVSNLLRLAL